MNKQRKTRDQSCRPFIQIDAELFKHLTPAELKVYGAIKARAWHENGECYESLDHMSKDIHISVNSIKRAAKSLLKQRIIAKEDRPGRTAIYTLTSPSEWVFTEWETPTKRSDTTRKPKPSAPAQKELPPSSKRANHPGQNELPTQAKMSYEVDPTQLDPIEESLKAGDLLRAREENSPSPLNDENLTKGEQIESRVFELNGQGVPAAQILLDLQQRNLIPDYRQHFRSLNAIDAEFARWIAESYLSNNDHYRENGATEGDARRWIARKEKGLCFDELLSFWSRFEKDQLPRVLVRRRSEAAQAIGMPNCVDNWSWPEKCGVRIYDLTEQEFQTYLVKFQAYADNRKAEQANRTARFYHAA